MTEEIQTERKSLSSSVAFEKWLRVQTFGMYLIVLSALTILGIIVSDLFLIEPVFSGVLITLIGVSILLGVCVRWW